MARKRHELKGRSFGRLVVLGDIESNKHGVKWLCHCECGNEVEVYSGNLIAGTSTSCGCYKTESGRARKLTHGLRKTRQWNIWSSMMKRCYIPTNIGYANYGGRGITVCKEWHELTNFYNWTLTSGYKDDLTLDRINNDGNYEPANCRWATRKFQANNRRNNNLLEVNGASKTIAAWSDESGIAHSVIKHRLKSGWEVKDAVSIPASFSNTHRMRNFKKEGESNEQ